MTTPRVTRTLTIHGTGHPSIADLRSFLDATAGVPDDTTVRLKTDAPDRPGELTTWSLEITAADTQPAYDADADLPTGLTTVTANRNVAPRFRPVPPVPQPLPSPARDEPTPC